MDKITTEQMVGNMLNESSEVISSLGGTREFRQVCDFVNLSKRCQDHEIMEEVERTPEQIANMVESGFPADVINKAKSVYCCS